MPAIAVDFRYYPGLSTDPFAAVTLLGSWDATGALSDGPWSAQPMTRVQAADGSIGYAATVNLDDAAAGRVRSREVGRNRAPAANSDPGTPGRCSRALRLTRRIQP